MDGHAFSSVRRLRLWYWGWRAEWIYRRHAETPLALGRLRKLAQSMLQVMASDHFGALLNLDRGLPLSRHSVVHLPEASGWRVAWHVLPPGEQIPPHAHPGMLSMLLVLRGELDVEQYSLDSDSRQREPCSEKKRLQAAEAVSVGLPGLLNAHALSATDSEVVFLSLRRRLSNKKKTGSYWRKCRVALCGIGLLCSSVCVTACEEQVAEGRAASDMEHAHRLRVAARDNEQSREAAKLYQAAADGGNAEAQYWLGVMYLHGDGVAMNRKTATRWVRLAAHQGYEPAESLYADLLNGWYDEMTGC